jgi:hypothetical protein
LGWEYWQGSENEMFYISRSPPYFVKIGYFFTYVKNDVREVWHLPLSGIALL